MSTKDLTKTAAARQKGNPYSFFSALKNGGPLVWLSCIIMGFGNIAAGQFIKGLLFLAIEVAVIAFMCTRGGGIYWLSMLPSLGDREMQEIWNDDKGVYEYVMGDNSQLILLYAVATIVILLVAVVAWQSSVRSGYCALATKRSGKKVPTIIDDIKGLFDENVHKTLMSLPVLFLGVLFSIPPKSS